MAMIFNRWRCLFVLCCCLFVMGCTWDFYMVKSSFIMPTPESTVAHVTRTDAYIKLIHSAKKIAVRAPEQCANETWAQSAGGDVIGDRKGILLKSSCGQEMAQMESGLAQQGYRVISWKVVQNKSITSKTTALDVAKDLGADLLLQVNSLERTRVVPGSDARWNRSYYESNSAGIEGEPVKVNKRISDQLNKLSKLHEKGMIDASRLSASLSTTAIAAATGEAIWFYEWTVVHDTDESRTNAITFSACKKERCKHWYPEDPQRVVQQTEYAGSSESLIRSPYTDEDRAIHSRLIKKIITDMIVQLKSGAE